MPNQEKISGVGDVALFGHHLYGLLSGAGCTHGVASVPNGIIKVHSDKTWEIFVNLSEYRIGHPVANPPADLNLMAPGSLIAGGDDLLH